MIHGPFVRCQAEISSQDIASALLCYDLLMGNYITIKHLLIYVHRPVVSRMYMRDSSTESLLLDQFYLTVNSSSFLRRAFICHNKFNVTMESTLLK